MNSPLLYEINTRCWLRELSEKAGRRLTLADVPEDEFARWGRLGFTHIWLMGVWSTGPRARAQALAHPQLLQAYAEALPDWREEDVGGSPYAIAEYRVLPGLGGDESLRIFRRRLHRQGLRLLLDFVPNHVGLDHPWRERRPELFVQSPTEQPETLRQDCGGGVRWLAYGKDPSWPAWTDTLQLDYRLPATRAEMLSVLQSIAARCDGVRCDMAMLVLKDVFASTWKAFPAAAEPLPEEFWPVAISSIKKAHAEFLFLAEAYWGSEGRLQDLGFDYTYDKVLYDKLIARDAAGAAGHLLALAPKTLAAGAHFLENHDERRIASLLSEPEHRAAALLILGLPGLRFLHQGQLSGTQARVPVQLLRRHSNRQAPAPGPPYDLLLPRLPGTAVGLGRGELLRPRAAWAGNPTFQCMVAVQWQKETPGFDLVVVNLASHRSQCYAPLKVPDLAARNWSMRDLLGEEKYERVGDDLQTQGLYLDLPPHGAQLFRFQPIS